MEEYTGYEMRQTYLREMSSMILCKRIGTVPVKKFRFFLKGL